MIIKYLFRFIKNNNNMNYSWLTHIQVSPFFDPVINLVLSKQKLQLKNSDLFLFLKTFIEI